MNAARNWTCPPAPSPPCARSAAATWICTITKSPRLSPRISRTRGRFIVEPKGYAFNTETIAGEVVIRGKFHGKLAAGKSLTIYSTAEIKGSFTAAHLIIPAGNVFRWREILNVGSAEIAGELAANLRATGTVALKSTARFFGDAAAGGLMVEPGAVVIGQMRVGLKPENHQTAFL